MANYTKLPILPAYFENDIWAFDKKVVAQVLMILFLKVSKKNRWEHVLVDCYHGNGTWHLVLDYYKM